MYAGLQSRMGKPISQFVCDYDEDVKKFIKECCCGMHSKMPIFGDVCDLQNEYAEDSRSALPERVPCHSDIHMAGWPCDDHSFANNKRADFIGCLSGTSIKEGKSSRAFDGLMNYLSTKQPKRILLENVGGILLKHGEGEKREVDAALDRIKANGYATKLIEVNSEKLGLPQKRKRIWIYGENIKHYAERNGHNLPEELGLCMARIEGSLTMWAEMVDDLCTPSRLPTLVVDSWLLAEDHGLVTKTAAEVRPPTKCAFRQGGSKKKKEEAWVAVHQAKYLNHDLHWTHPENRPGAYYNNAFFTSRVPRQQDIILFEDAVDPVARYDTTQGEICREL